MKKILAFSAAIGISAGVHSQPGTDSRLIATATFEYQDSVFVPVDSTRLTYTGNNGWDYATNNWKYDSLRVWTPVPFSAWSEDKHHVQQMMNDRIVTRLLGGGVAGSGKNRLYVCKWIGSAKAG